MKYLQSLLILAAFAVGSFMGTTATAGDTCAAPAPPATDPTAACASANARSVDLKYGRFGAAETGITTFRIWPPTVRMDRAGPNQKKVIINLTAVGSEFHDNEVTITSAGNDWLSGKAKFSDPGSKIEFCIPDSCAEGEYKYDVHVEDFGKLDPHVKVEN